MDIETQIRLAILKGLKAASGFAMPEETLVSEIIFLIRPNPTEKDVKKQIRSLLDDALIFCISDSISKKCKYALTEKGQVSLNQ